MVLALDSLVIRPAERVDLPRLGRLGSLLVEEHHDFDPQRFLATSPRMPAEYAGFLDTQLEAPDAIMLVAHIDEDVIGYLYATVQGVDYMTLRGPAAMIHDLIVDPEYRSRGVGEALIEAALQALAARGAPRAVLMTAARNTEAQRLFGRLGFRPTMIEMTREFDA